MILLIDNYDSFSYNVYQLIGSLDPEIRVIRNDGISIEEIQKLQPSAIILSPGPGRPADAGICEDAVRAFRGRIPILGICLGHQAICEVYGAKITYAKKLMHGKQSDILIDQKSPLFCGLPERIPVGRYHSLAADPETIPASLKIIATAADGEIMAVQDIHTKTFGLQFHPESIMTPDGRQILKNFLECR